MTRPLGRTEDVVFRKETMILSPQATMIRFVYRHWKEAAFMVLSTYL
jgi:hypothetical protein